MGVDDRKRITVWLGMKDLAWLDAAKKRIDGYGKACVVVTTQLGSALFYVDGYYVNGLWVQE